MSYKLINIRKDGSKYDLSQIYSSIKWTGDINQASRSLDVELLFCDNDLLPDYIVELGSMIILYSSDVELFRGLVFETNRGHTGSVNIKSYDHMIYLLKSEATKIYNGLTASSMIRALCLEFGVPVGNIAETGITMNRIYRNKSIFDMCISSLTETSIRTGKNYFMQMSQGKLNVIQKDPEKATWIIESGTNLSSASFIESIEDMKNKIVIIGEKDEIIATVQDNALISSFGIFQEISNESANTLAEAQLIASELLDQKGVVKRELDIIALGIDQVIAGEAIVYRDEFLGFEGTFYVEKDSHDIQNNNHTMNLTLKLTDEVAVKYLKQPNKKSGKKKKGSNLSWSV
jgi:hypothetical protein